MVHTGSAGGDIHSVRPPCRRSSEALAPTCRRTPPRRAPTSVVWIVYGGKQQTVEVDDDAALEGVESRLVRAEAWASRTGTAVADDRLTLADMAMKRDRWLLVGAPRRDATGEPVRTRC